MYMLNLITLFTLLGKAATYYGQLDYKAPCTAVIAQCTTDIGTTNPCSALYERYMEACSSQFGEVKQCSEKCKPRFKSLTRHPMFSTFPTCDCQGNNLCVKQKCILVEGCLGEPCLDAPAPTVEVPPEITYDSWRTTVTTTTGTFRTLPSTTMALNKINCESLIMRCMDTSPCQHLLQKRDKLCKEYTVEGSEICTKHCIDANTALLDSGIGYYMKTCTFDKVSTEATRLINLIRVCSPPDTPTTSESPSITDSYPTRSNGDCKRHYNECSKNKSCQKSFTTMITACKGIKCTTTCLSALSKFKAMKEGLSLYHCHCDVLEPARNCLAIRSRITTACNDYVTTEEPSSISVDVPDTYPPTIPFPQLITVSHVCEDLIKITIRYSPEMGEPLVTTKDGSCQATNLPGHVMTLELKYDETECGTEKIMFPDGILDYRNILYIKNEIVRTNSQYEIHCSKSNKMAVTENPSPNKKDTTSVLSHKQNIKMRFYKDELYKTTFQNYPEDLGEIKRVYVELQTKNISSNIKTFIETCYATPESTPDYPQPHYLIRNGCGKDTSLKMHTIADPYNTRFSFYRMKFADQAVGQVYVHCNMTVCSHHDKDCHLSCRQGRTNYTTYTVSQGPYTFSSGAGRLEGSLVILIITLIHHILR